MAEQTKILNELVKKELEKTQIQMEIDNLNMAQFKLKYKKLALDIYHIALPILSTAVCYFATEDIALGLLGGAVATGCGIVPYKYKEIEFQKNRNNENIEKKIEERGKVLTEIDYLKSYVNE